MRKLILSLSVLVSVSAVMWACKGNSSPSGPSTPGNGNTGGNNSGFSSTPTVAGQPSDLDLARLASRFGTIGAQVIQQTLSGSSGTSSAGMAQTAGGIGVRALTAPATTSAVNASYLCCADTAASDLQVTGTIGAATAGSVTVALRYNSTNALQWSGVNAGTSWDLTFPSGSLIVAATLTTTGGSIGPNQQVTLTGTVVYSLKGSSTQNSVPVSLAFFYPDLSAVATNDAGASNALTTTGAFGTLQLANVQVPSISMTGRCSAPQEGCGALVSGFCPCTKWPPCPSYGLSCPGTFK